MRVISKKRIKEFCQKHADSCSVLENWHTIVSKTRYNAFHDLRKTFPSADLVDNLTVFNIGGNKFRLIAAIHYNTQMIFIRHILTHAEYDKEKWKK